MDILINLQSVEQNSLSSFLMFEDKGNGKKSFQAWYFVDLLYVVLNAVLLKPSAMISKTLELTVSTIF